MIECNREIDIYFFFFLLNEIDIYFTVCINIIFNRIIIYFIHIFISQIRMSQIWTWNYYYSLKGFLLTDMHNFFEGTDMHD